MAAGTKKSKAKWVSEADRKIDIWTDIMEEYNGKVLRRLRWQFKTYLRLQQ